MPGVTDTSKDADNQPQTLLIELLEEHLELAKTGQLQSIALATVEVGGFVAFDYYVGTGCSHDMAAAIGDLQHDFHAWRRGQRRRIEMELDNDDN